jgi:hypothetical protein
MKFSELAKRDEVRAYALRPTFIFRFLDSGRKISRRIKEGEQLTGSFGTHTPDGWAAIHVDLDQVVPCVWWYLHPADFFWQAYVTVDLDTDDNLTAYELHFLEENRLSRHQLKRLRTLADSLKAARTKNETKDRRATLRRYAIENCGFTRVYWGPPGHPSGPGLKGPYGFWKIPNENGGMI